jgi:uncharacterized protein (TIGR03067 family)
MRWYSWSAALLVLVGAGLAGARGTAGDRAKLQGSWQVVGFEQNGKKPSGPEMEILSLWMGRVVIDGNRIALVRGSRTGTLGRFTLNEAASPRAVDLVISNGRGREETRPGIYSLKGDELRVCIAGDGSDKRPTDFTTGPSLKRWVYVLRRQGAGEAAAFDLRFREVERLTGRWRLTSVRVGEVAATPEQLRGLDVSVNGLVNQSLVFRRDRRVLGEAGYLVDPMRFNLMEVVVRRDVPLAPCLTLEAGAYRGTYSAVRPGELRIFVSRQGPQAAGSPLVTLLLRRQG